MVSASRAADMRAAAGTMSIHALGSARAIRLMTKSEVTASRDTSSSHFGLSYTGLAQCRV